MLTPDFAIVTYRNKDKEIKHIEKGDFVKGKNNDYVLSGLRPFIDDELEKLQTVMSQNKGLYFDGLVPKGLLYVNTIPSNAVIAWHVPKGPRVLNFKDEKLRGKYDVPDTVFIIHNSEIRIYIVKKKDAEKIGLKTKLYKSYYFNIWDSCLLCIGNGYKPNFSYIGVNEMIDKVTQDFFEGSYFTHPNTDHDLQRKIWESQNGKHPETKWKKIATIKQVLSRFVKL